MTFAAVFALVIGIGMIIQWGLSFASQQIPELRSEPIRIGFHLAGEAATAILLIISGIGLLRSALWAPTVFYIAAGMLLYTAIVSPGYFAQQGNWKWLIFFGAILVLSVSALLAVSRAAVP